MFRRKLQADRSRRIPWRAISIVLGCTVAAALTPNVHADEVAAFLEEQGLTELLAAHLEQELETAIDAEKQAIIRKLANLYVVLLAEQEDAASRAGLEARANLLLEQTSAGEAMELRLALAQTTYRQVEGIAEQHRLRATDDADIERATGMTTQLTEHLEQIRSRVAGLLEDSMRKLSRASGSDSIMLAEKSEREQRILDQSTYLLAWTLYYQAWLTDDVAPAERAELLFGELLDPGQPRLPPADVSFDLRANESIARAILGMALCRSITRSDTTALEWIALLEHEETAASVRNEVPAWRLVILLEHGQFDRVTDIAESIEGGLESAPTPWLRLIAAWSLETGKANADALRLAKQAMTALAASGALEHLIQLAERYGTDALGETGFAPLYVQAVLGFQVVRKDHPGDKPAAAKSIQDRFADVGATFERAVAQPDASLYPDAGANASLLAAWCKYFRSDFLDASTAFERAAELPALDEPDEALWMAVVCLDYLVSADENPNLERRMSLLVDRYLERYPAGSHVPELLMRKSYDDVADTAGMVQSLLAVPPQSSAYLPARQRAALLLYEQCRRARGDERVERAREFLAVQQPLLSRALDQTLASDDREARRRLIVRCRQVLDAATTANVRDLGAASEALDVLDQLASAGASLDDIADEVGARRVQVELMAGRVAAACAHADQLWERDQDSPWARLAARAVFRELLLDRQSDEFATAERGTLELIARYGGRVIQEFTGKPDTWGRQETMTYHVIVAEASLELWRRTQDEERAGAALFIFERLLDRQPNDARFLRVTAELAGILGQEDRALECWRTLLAGLESGSDAWYEAKYNQVELLSRHDPARALEVLRQHVHLEGEYGPEPWGEKLRALEEELEAGSGDGDEHMDEEPAE